MAGTDLKELLDFNPNRRGPNIWFKPRPGSSGAETNFKVRLLPPWHEDEKVPFYSAVQHYLGQYGDKNALSGTCPASVGDEECPACDWFWTVRSVIDPKVEKDLVKALRPLGPNRRLYCNVLDRDDDQIKAWSLPLGGDESAGVRLLGLVKQLATEDIDLSNPVDGRDIIVTVFNRGQGLRYGQFSYSPRKSKAEFDPEGLHDLPTVATSKVLTPQQIVDYIPTALGEHYDVLNTLYEQGKTNERSKTQPGSLPDFKSMTIKDLKGMATDLKVEFPAKVKKADLVTMVKRAMG